MSVEKKFLIENGCYQNTNFNINKIFPSISFYSQLIQQVLSSAFLAKKGVYSHEELRKNSQKIFQTLEKTGLKITLEGLEHVSNTDPVVFSSNHNSGLETFLMPGLIAQKDISFIVKDSLMNYPAFGQILEATDAIPVTRNNPREDFKTIMEKGSEMIQKENSIMIFPQGKREPIFNPENMSSMGNKLAKKNNIPLIAVALKTDAQLPGKILKDFGKIKPQNDLHISFSPPISSKNSKDAALQINNFIESEINSWK